jgi:hypothetical protein
MKFFFSSLITAFLILFFSGCVSKRADNNTQDLSLLSVKQIPFHISTLEKGTPLKIIAFSGGKQSDKEHTYYNQFITVNQSTGDTIRVLAPLISVGEENIYTTPVQYNHDKGIEMATFEPKDSSFDFKINAFAAGEQSPADGKAFEKLQEKSNAEETVFMVKGIPLFESNRYKTVIGALHFNEQPW